MGHAAPSHAFCLIGSEIRRRGYDLIWFKCRTRENAMPYGIAIFCRCRALALSSRTPHCSVESSRHVSGTVYRGFAEKTRAHVQANVTGCYRVRHTFSTTVDVAHDESRVEYVPWRSALPKYAARALLSSWLLLFSSMSKLARRRVSPRGSGKREGKPKSSAARFILRSNRPKRERANVSTAFSTTPCDFSASTWPVRPPRRGYGLPRPVPYVVGLRRGQFTGTRVRTILLLPLHIRTQGVIFPFYFYFFLSPNGRAGVLFW